MNNNTKTIALVGGGVVLIVVAVVLATRRKDDSNNTNGGLVDPSSTTNEAALKGQFLGNFLSSLWAGTRNQTNTGNPNPPNEEGLCNGVAVPIDPYVADGFNKDLYNSNQIKSMQTYLSSLHQDIADIITDTGGVDGIVGDGFKTAYNMARKGGYITGLNDLITKSGA